MTLVRLDKSTNLLPKIVFALGFCFTLGASRYHLFFGGRLRMSLDSPAASTTSSLSGILPSFVLVTENNKWPENSGSSHREHPQTLHTMAIISLTKSISSMTIDTNNQQYRPKNALQLCAAYGILCSMCTPNPQATVIYPAAAPFTDLFCFEDGVRVACHGVWCHRGRLRKRLGVRHYASVVVAQDRTAVVITWQSTDNLLD